MSEQTVVKSHKGSNSNANVEISFVEISIFFFKKGSLGYSALLDDLDYSYPQWEDCVEDINENEIKSPFKDNDIVFIQDCCGFNFTFIGQNFDSSYHSGAHWEYCEGYQEEFFEGAIEDLIKWGELRLKEHNEKMKFMQNRYETNFVRFITAWEWTSYEDSYYHEFKTDWNLLGLVDLDNIKKVIKENI